MIQRRMLIAGLAALPLAPARAQAPRPRIVALGGDVAEIIAALGHADALVGCDETCQFPAAVTRLPRAGYVRAFSAEGVLSMRPTLVIAAASAGPPAALAQLRAAGVRVVSIPDARDEAALLEKVRATGLALGASGEAERLAAQLRARLDRLEARVAADPRRPRTLALMAGARGALMASGEGTAADAVIRLAGGRNIFTASGVKPLTPEAGLAAAPEVLLAPSHVLDSLGGRARILANPALAATPAGRAGRLVTMDSLKLLGFGPRLPEAAEELFLALRVSPSARTGRA
jgi:iron complex transport system substrate-binding protein